MCCFIGRCTVRLNHPLALAHGSLQRVNCHCKHQQSQLLLKWEELLQNIFYTIVLQDVGFDDIPGIGFNSFDIRRNSGNGEGMVKFGPILNVGDYYVQVSFQEEKCLYPGVQRLASQSSCLACCLVRTNLLSPWASLGTWERTARQSGSRLLGKMMIKTGWGRDSRSLIICSKFGSIFFHLIAKYNWYLVFFGSILLIFCSCRTLFPLIQHYPH